MNILFENHRKYQNHSLYTKEGRLVYEGEKPDCSLEGNAASQECRKRLEDLKTGVDILRNDKRFYLRPIGDETNNRKHQTAAERARSGKEEAPELSDPLESARREKIKNQCLRQLYNVSFQEYVEKKFKGDENKAIQDTIRLITEKPEQFYYSEIGQSIVVKQRPESTEAMPEAKLPLVFDQNGAIRQVGEWELNPRQWESWPVAPEQMQEFEVERLQMAMPAISRQYLNPSFSIYLEDTLGYDWQNNPVIRAMETVMEHSNSDDLQYHMEGSRLVILKRHPGGEPKEIPDDLYLAIDTTTGNVIQVGRQTLDTTRWDTWSTVLRRITELKKIYKKKERDLNGEELRYREAYAFRLPHRFGKLVTLRKELSPEEKNEFASGTFTGPEGLYERLKNHTPGPRDNDDMDNFLSRSTRISVRNEALQPNTIGLRMGEMHIVFNTEGYLLRPTPEDEFKFRPNGNYREAYKNRYHKTREEPFQNPLANILGAVRTTEVLNKYEEVAKNLPNRIIIYDVKNLNEATAVAKARIAAAEKIGIEVQKVLKIDPPHPQLKLKLAKEFFPAESVTYDRDTKKAQVNLVLDSDLKEKAVREFLSQNGLPLPAEKAAIEWPGRYTFKEQGSNEAEATQKTKAAALEAIREQVEKATGVAGGKLTEADIEGGITVNVDRTTKTGEANVNLGREQRQKVAKNYLLAQKADKMTLTPVPAAGANEAAAKAEATNFALQSINLAIKANLSIALPPEAQDLVEADVSGILPDLRATPPTPPGTEWQAILPIDTLTSDQKKTIVGKYLEKNKIPLEALMPEKPQPDLARKVSRIRQYELYENAANLIDATEVGEGGVAQGILREGEGGEAIAKKAAQEKVIKNWTEQLCKRMGLSATEFPFTLANFDAFSLDDFTTYDRAAKKAVVKIEAPIPEAFRASFVKNYLRHYNFKIRDGVPDPAEQVFFGPETTVEEALQRLPKTPSPAGQPYGTESHIIAMGQPTTPPKEKTLFEEAFNAHKAQFDKTADIRSPKNYPVWYRLIQDWKGKEIDEQLGKGLAERIIRPMNDLIAADIQSKFKGTALQENTRAQEQLDNLLAEIKSGDFKGNPEMIIALSRGNIGDQTAEIQTQAKGVIENYFPRNAKDVIRVLAIR